MPLVPLSALLLLFLKDNILYGKGSELGGPDRDKMVACGLIGY